MPTFVTSGTDAPAGVPIMSASGRLAAVVHAGFPGVLLGIFDAGADSLGIERLDLADPARGWVTVRTAGPMWLSVGSGVAYDLEAEYGRTYVYRPAYWGEPDPRHSVVVRMPDDYGSPDISGALKSIWSPELSMFVHVERPQPFRRAAPGGSETWRGRDRRAGQLTFTHFPEDREPLEDLLSSGPLLWQPCRDIDDRAMYLLPGDLEEEQTPVASGGALRRFTVDFVQVPRPLDLDTPPVIPGWTWAAATADLTLADVDRTYPDEWQMLLAGVQGWAGAGTS